MQKREKSNTTGEESTGAISCPCVLHVCVLMPARVHMQHQFRPVWGPSWDALECSWGGLGLVLGGLGAVLGSLGATPTPTHAQTQQAQHTQHNEHSTQKNTQPKKTTPKNMQTNTKRKQQTHHTQHTQPSTHIKTPKKKPYIKNYATPDRPPRRLLC